MNKLTKDILRAAVVFTAVAVLALTQDLKSLFETMRNINLLYLFAGVLFFIITTFFCALRWRGLLKTLGIDFPFWAAVKVNYVGLFYNNMLLSAIGGDLLRGWYITKYSHKRLEAAFSVLIDRLFGLVTCFLMALVGLFFAKDLFSSQSLQDAGESTASQISPLVVVLALLAAAVLLAAIALAAYKTGKLKRLIRDLQENWKRFHSAIMLYAKNPLSIIKAIIITFIGQSFTVIGIYVASRSLGIEASLGVYFIFFPLSWVIGAIPISPGGFGVLELGIVAMFATLPQVSGEQALAVALCQRLIFILGSLPGLAIHLLGMHLPKD